MSYTNFERTVIALYNVGVLTLDLLDTLAEMYRGMEVDSAGGNNLITNDGKDMQQLCLTLVDPMFTLAERESRDDDEYWERELKVWSHIINTRWGWC